MSTSFNEIYNICDNYIKNTKTVQYKTLNKEMILFIYLFIYFNFFFFFWGGGGGPDLLGNMEGLQRDGLVRIKAVDASWLPVRQIKIICF